MLSAMAQCKMPACPTEADRQNRNDLSKRLLEFASSSIKLTIKLKRTALGRYIANQLKRAASSSGANYEEACGAESKADFISRQAGCCSIFLTC